MSILEEQKQTLAKIFPNVDYFAEMGAGYDFNFPIPSDEYVLEKQIRELKKAGYFVNQISFKTNHIWIKKIQTWDEEFS